MRRLVIAVAVSCVAAVFAAPAQGSVGHLSAAAKPGAAVAANYAFQGNAYGTKATLGHTVTSGRTAPVGLGCSVAPGVHKTNTAAGVSAPPLLGAGTINTTADTYASPIEAKTSAEVQDLGMLSGLITATAIKSVSSTTHTASGFDTSSAGTSFTKLVIAGVPVTGVVDPNTKVDVPLFGYIVLNEQVEKIGKRSASLTVNGLHLVITLDNALGIPVGTEVVVAHANSGLSGPIEKVVDGFAYGSRAKVGDVIASGPSFKVSLPCLGTNGRIRVSKGAGVSVGEILKTGQIRNTAEGTVDADSASAETTSSVDNANLLSGLVHAKTIKADAHAAGNANGTTFSDNGSSFAELDVQGHPEINADVPANTKVHIAGLGTLWLHRVIHRQSSIEVRMIELIVRHENVLGLPIGSNLQVAVAHASVH